ncbi:protein-(glutamine-N5) methyltransferase, release factor-specific [Alphaproteobacteria bacterium 46_93_T64]|nr:protein-(glutamine-N5) methyltransferase, release factor-specific [Alphaproteobacteria bacterium 46_93_T64]
MRIDEALRGATKLLAAHSIDGARRDASVLLVSVLGGDREILFRAPEQILTEPEVQQFQKLIDRRATREPVSHILGQREFWSRDFFVTSDVLDPRPDSETLIDAVLKHTKETRAPDAILDLGTGSGCLLLTLLAEIKNAKGVGVDLSDKALEIAVKNAKSLSLEDRSSFLKSLWFENVSGTFDVIVSNPPYIETDDIAGLQTEVRDFEPRLALDGGEDGLECYRQITAEISVFLKPEGFVIFEVGIGQDVAVGNLMRGAGFENIKVHYDLASVARCVSGQSKK